MRENITITLVICEITDQEITDFSVALLEYRKNSLEKIDSKNFWVEVNQVAQRLDSLLNGFLSQVKII